MDINIQMGNLMGLIRFQNLKELIILGINNHQQCRNPNGVGILKVNKI